MAHSIRMSEVPPSQRGDAAEFIKSHLKLRPGRRPAKPTPAMRIKPAAEDDSEIISLLLIIND